MKQVAYILAAAVLFLCVPTGCSHRSEPELHSQTAWDLTEVEPTYVTEWPENEFTSQIAEPENGEVDYVCDYSDSMRYLLVIKEISEAESSEYIRQLEAQGYSEIASEGNNVSVGTLMQRENVILSITYSGEMLGILITIDRGA